MTHCNLSANQPRSQPLSPLLPLSLGRMTPVAAGHATIPSLGGKKCVVWEEWQSVLIVAAKLLESLSSKTIESGERAL